MLPSVHKIESFPVVDLVNRIKFVQRDLFNYKIENWQKEVSEKVRFVIETKSGRKLFFFLLKSRRKKS